MKKLIDHQLDTPPSRRIRERQQIERSTRQSHVLHASGFTFGGLTVMALAYAAALGFATSDDLAALTIGAALSSLSHFLAVWIRPRA